MRHAAYRISQYLQSAYPDARWEWVTPSPVRERAIAKGGEIKIRIYDLPDYNGGMIAFEQSGRMEIRLIKEVRLEDAVSNETDAEKPEQDSQDEPQDVNAEPKVVDVSAWYAIQGKFLRQIVEEFQSHGYKSLFIKEDGTVSVDNGGTSVPKDRLGFFPPKKLWPGLVRAMQEDGLSACPAEDRLVVNF